MKPNRIIFRVDGQPLPKERPRIGNGRAYTPSRTQEWENTIAAVMAQQFPKLEPDGDARFKLHCFFARKGKRKCDVDNLVKVCMDAVNTFGRVWQDDEQVDVISAIKEYGYDKPYVIIRIEQLSSGTGMSPAATP